MIPSQFSDYIERLRADLTELRAGSGVFQSYDLSIEMMVEQMLISYGRKRQKSVEDNLFYRRSVVSGAGAQLEEDTAFRIFEHFLSLPQHIALSADAAGMDPAAFAEAVTVRWQFPVCAVRLSYRKKGAPKAVSTRMLLVGLNDEDDVSDFCKGFSMPQWIVVERPLSTSLFWEFR
jgi:hypothetical protein